MASCWVAAGAPCLDESFLDEGALALMDLIASERGAGFALAFGPAGAAFGVTALAGFDATLETGAVFLGAGLGFAGLFFRAAGLGLAGDGFLAFDWGALGAGFDAFFATGVGFLTVGLAFAGLFFTGTALGLAWAGFLAFGGFLTGFAGAFALG